MCKYGIGDWGLGIGDWGLGPIPNPQSPIPNPQSPIPNPQSPIPNPQSPIPNPQSPIPNPQSPIPNPQSPIPNPQSPKKIIKNNIKSIYIFNYLHLLNIIYLIFFLLDFFSKISIAISIKAIDKEAILKKSICFPKKYNEAIIDMIFLIPEIIDSSKGFQYLTEE